MLKSLMNWAIPHPSTVLCSSAFHSVISLCPNLSASASSPNTLLTPVCLSKGVGVVKFPRGSPHYHAHLKIHTGKRKTWCSSTIHETTYHPPRSTKNKLRVRFSKDETHYEVFPSEGYQNGSIQHRREKCTGRVLIQTAAHERHGLDDAQTLIQTPP